MQHSSLQRAYRIVIALFFSAALCGCLEKNTHYFAFNPIHTDGWDAMDTLTFVTDTLHTSTESGIELLIHTESYIYENIGLYISIEQDSRAIYCDTINTELKSNNPQKGIARRADYTIPITNLSLHGNTHTTIKLAHLMGDPSLKGIREIGIRIGSPVRHPGEAVWQVEW